MADEPEFTPPPRRTVPASLAADLRAPYQDIMVQLDLMQVAGIKKRKRVGDVGRPAYDRIIGASRVFPRAGHPNFNATLIFLVGPAAVWGPPVRDAAAGEAVEDDFPIPDKATHEKIFRLMLSCCKDLEPLLKFLYIHSLQDPTPWSQLTKRMATAADEARTNDTNKFKDLTAELLVPTPQHILYPTLSSSSKSDRGFKHETLRLFLMNAKDRHHLPEPAFAKPKTSHPGQLEMPDQSAEIISDTGEVLLKQMNDGTYSFKPKTLPWIYYGAYTPGDPTERLFRSDSFVRAMRLLWLGEKSMLTGLNGSLPDLRTNARICNVWKVTPEMVGYVACQLRVMLTPYDWSSTRATTTKRKSNTASAADEFNYGAHFKFIIGLFSDALYADWATETLEFLQSAVFGDATDPNEDLDDTQADSDDEFAAHRRGRLAALNAAASIAPS